MQAILLAVLQYVLPGVLSIVAQHQAAHNGVMPTPAQVLNHPDLQNLSSQSAAWLSSNATK